LLAPRAGCLAQASLLVDLNHLRPSTPERNGQFAFVAGDSGRSLKPYIIGGSVGGVLGLYAGFLAIGGCETPQCPNEHRAAPYLGAAAGVAVGVAIVALVELIPRQPVGHPRPPNERWRSLAISGLANASQDGQAQAQTVVGCWKVEPGKFSVVGKNGADRGQTILPLVVQFDTLPGKSLSGEPFGRLVRGLGADNGTRYRDGYYALSGTDSLRVDWTTGFIGMTLVLRLDNAVMHGRASAWTDYMGNEQAPVVLRRAVCPGVR
jgi:hypothetical protein